MELIKCEVCSKQIDIRYRKKDYLVVTHYFAGNMKRFYLCSICLPDLEKTIEGLKRVSKEEYYKKHPEYKYFYYLGISRETGLRYFALKEQLDKDIWKRISNFFYFCSYSSEEYDKDPPDSARGRWVTNKPKDVLKALGWKQ